MTASFPLAPVGPPLGVPADPQFVRVMNRTASAVVQGELVMFDLHSTDTDVTNFTVGDDNSVLANVIPAKNTGLARGWFGIVQEPAADNAQTVVCVRGRTKALVVGTAALTSILTMIEDQVELDADDPAADTLIKVLGIPLEISAGDTAELIEVLFNGIEGLGYHISVTPNPP